MSTDLKPYLQYLQGLETISIADLQYAMQCSYPKAREVLQQFRKNGYVSSTVQGISSVINAQLRDRRSMSFEQVRSVVSQLPSTEIMLLDIIFDAMQRGGYRYEPLKDEDREVAEQLEKLAELQMIHTFEGLLYPSIDDETWEMIRKAEKEKLNEPCLIILALPVLEKSVAMNDAPTTFYNLCLIPQSCKDYVRDTFDEYLQTRNKPQILAVKLEVLSEYKFRIALDMLNAVLRAKRGLDSAAAYVRYAEMCARKMRNMDLWDDVVYDAADEAIQMLSEMSLEEIRSLQQQQDEDDWD